MTDLKKAIASTVFLGAFWSTQKPRNPLLQPWSFEEWALLIPAETIGFTLASLFVAFFACLILSTIASAQGNEFRPAFKTRFPGSILLSIILVGSLYGIEEYKKSETYKIFSDTIQPGERNLMYYTFIERRGFIGLSLKEFKHCLGLIPSSAHHLIGN